MCQKNENLIIHGEQKMDTVKPERRKYKRSNITTEIAVSFSYQKQQNELVGMINDISPHGLGITVAVNVPAETLIDITMGETNENHFLKEERFLGEVRWCRPDPLMEESYNLGIKIRDLTRG